MYYLLQIVRVLVAWWGVMIAGLLIDHTLIDAGLIDDFAPTSVLVFLSGFAFWALGFPLRRYARSFASWSPLNAKACVAVTFVLALLCHVGERRVPTYEICDIVENWRQPGVCN